jgi:hypothetical protein
MHSLPASVWSAARFLMASTPLLVGVVVVLLFVLWRATDVPVYRFRGLAITLSALAFAVAGGLLILHLWPGAQAAAATRVQSQIGLTPDTTLVDIPVQALDQYVATMPGTDTPARHEQPSMNGLPSGTVWDETTSRSVAEVVRFYHVDDNHAGWQIEVEAPTGVVLRRTNTVLGRLETERLRIQATPNPDVGGPRTRVEFELTRRMK